MPAPTPITSALELAQDAITAALGALVPVGAAWWDAAPASEKLVSRLRAAITPLTGVTPLACAYVAQHQDGGGRPVRYVADEGWAGLVVVRVLSATDAGARAGLALAVGAMAALSSPAGYALSARWDRPISVPRDPDGIYTRAGQWRVSIERT
jgi:hypothetical protein